jgi:ribonuclease BN (tRNA processing enzyme)
MAALHTDVTEVGGVAERARVRELILSHYLPADPDAIPEADSGWRQYSNPGPWQGSQRPAGGVRARAFSPDADLS